MRDHILLTGGSGFLGKEIVKQLLKKKKNIALLLREDNKTSLTKKFLNTITFDKPVEISSDIRPMKGNLLQQYGGLSEANLDWIKDHCYLIINCAADTNFDTTIYTNADSTTSAIDIAKKCNIEHFQHISTAYVCGKTNNTIVYEDKVVGYKDEYNNDYELSKFWAEQRVYSSNLNYLIYRPTIITGSSEDGSSSRFDNFYTAIKLAYKLAKYKKSSWLPDSADLRINLSGHELMNLVPVDFVAKCIVYLSMDPGEKLYYHQIYNLAAPNPPSVKDIINAISSYFGFTGIRFIGPFEIENKNYVEKLFYDSLKEYNMYFGKEPSFSTTNITNMLAASNIMEIPKIDSNYLNKIIDYAVKTEFGKKKFVGV